MSVPGCTTSRRCAWRAAIAGLSGLVVDIDGLCGHVSRRRPAAAGGARRPRQCRRRSSASATVWRRRCRSARSTGLGLAAPPVFQLQAGAASRSAGRWRCRMAGSVACSIRWAGRWTGTGRCRPAARSGRVRAAPPEATDAGAAGSPARSRRARAQLLRHLPPGPAARPVLRLRHRQVDPARHAGAPHRLRCRRARPGRRARTRGAGVPRGRSGRGRAGALGRRGRHLGFAAAAAPRGGLRRHDGGRAFPRPGQVGAAADGQRHPVLPGVARDRAVGRRAAGDARLSAQRVRRTAAPAGARRPRTGPAGRSDRPHHRAVHRAGRGRRPQRTGRRRGARHPGRPRRAGSPHRRGRPLSGGRRAALAVARRARAATRRRRTPWRAAPARCWRCTPTWPTWCGWAPTAPAAIPAVDEAVALAPRIEAMLRQERDEHTNIEDSFALLRAALEPP